MQTVTLSEFVHYYDAMPWRSCRGKLTIERDLLVFQSFSDIPIPLRSISKIELKTTQQVFRSGQALPDLEFKPRPMLFLCLEFEIALVEVLGRTAKRTVIFGSCFNAVKAANRQMENTKRVIFRARANALFESRKALGSAKPVPRQPSSNLGRPPTERNQPAYQTKGLGRWLKSIFQ